MAQMIRKAAVAAALPKVLALKGFPPAYFDLSVEERQELCRALPGDFPFLKDEVLGAERLERRLGYLMGNLGAVTKAS